jgi:hypothetical protein
MNGDYSTMEPAYAAGYANISVLVPEKPARCARTALIVDAFA